jgi:transglutaminase-like putative cysteine protease
MNWGLTLLRRRCSLCSLLATLALIVGGAPAVRAQAKAQESWYLYRIAGQDVGHVHETMRHAGDAVTTTVETLVVINRLGSKVEIKGKAVFVEAADGKLRSARSETSTSRQATTLEAWVEEGKVRLVVATGGKEYRRELPASGLVLGPWGLRQQTARGLHKEGDVADGLILVPELERLVRVTRKLLEADAKLSAPGLKGECARAQERMEGYPGTRTVWLDRDGRMVRQTEPSPLGETEVILSDRLVALGAGGGTLPAEMYDATLVRANVRLPGPRALERLVVRLRHKDTALDWPELEGPGQRVLRREGAELLLEVRQVKASQAAPPADREDLREYLAPNAVLQCDDSEVRRVAREVAGDEADAWRAACRLRDWVARNMKFDLGMVVTPASEVIRQRRGTCMAYAVALASLARAAGVPTRVVMGYVYVEGIWGGHAWVEVRAAGRWVPLDGALVSPGPADAARIGCVRSSLAGGAGSLLGPLAQLFGNVRVRVVEYEVGGVRTPVPEGARAFAIDDDIYRNPWLGVEARRPADFRFTDSDAVYPDSTVVALRGPAGEKVRLRQEGGGGWRDGEDARAAALSGLGFAGKPAREQVAGRDALVVTDGARAALAFVEGADVWVLTAEGSHAGELLRRAASWVTVGPRGR